MLGKKIKYDWKKNIKRGIVYISVFGMLMSTKALATENSFIKAKVDSNEWTPVRGATTESASESCKLELTNIYKSDGSDSNYKVIRGRVQCGSTRASVSKNIKIKKGCNSIDLLEKYQVKGKTLLFYGMGNDPSRDCQISGTFYVH